MTPPPGQSFRLFLDAAAAFSPPPPSSQLSTSAWSSTPAASRALSFLTPSDRTRVLRFHRPCDAALSLGSCLLKHYAVARGVDVAWSDFHISADRSIRNGKPFYAAGGVEFNVSHHGDVVVLVASTVPGVSVGIDVVKADVVRDRQAVQREGGWERWVRIFSDAFTDTEMEKMVNALSNWGGGEEERLRERLRFFYAHWALKEGYIKLTGDALLATWLKELEFNPVVVPKPVGEAKWSMGEVTDSKAWLRGVAVEDAKIEIQALGEHYMVATAVSGISEMPAFQEITVDEILRLASE